MNKHAYTLLTIDSSIGYGIFVAILIAVSMMLDVIDSNGGLKYIWLGTMIYFVLAGKYKFKLRKSHAPTKLKFKGSWSELTDILTFEMNLKLESKIGEYYMFKETHRFIPSNYVQVLKTDEGFELIVRDQPGWLVKGLLECAGFEKSYLDQQKII